VTGIHSSFIAACVVSRLTVSINIIPGRFFVLVDIRKIDKIDNVVRWATKSHKQHVTSEPRYHTVEMYDSAIIASVCLVMTLTFDLISNSHSYDEYLWQVSLKSVHYVKRYRGTRISVNGDLQLDGQPKA